MIQTLTSEITQTRTHVLSFEVLLGDFLVEGVDIEPDKKDQQERGEQRNGESGPYVSTELVEVIAHLVPLHMVVALQPDVGNASSSAGG